MTVRVEVVQGDGTTTMVDEAFADIGSAATFALQLANDLGRTATPYSQGHGLARKVVLRSDGQVVIEIAVFAGGLSSTPPFEGELRLPTGP